MSKKSFVLPTLLSMGGGGDGNVIGGGTGQGGSDAIPMTFEEWKKTAFAHDFNENGIDFMDYVWWWLDQGFDTGDLWNEYNPGTPWDPDWEE